MKTLEFIKLIRNRIKSDEDYTNFQKYQAEWVLDDLKKKHDLGGLILDLGSGMGGYTIELEKKAKMIYSVDLEICRDFPIGKKIVPIRGEALNLPFKDNTLDFIFCSSLIEHVAEPELLLSEINRILKEGKFCYLSFPPFYSPVGGHQYKPFHLLGERSAIYFTKLLKKIEVKDFKNSYGNWGLYPMTISKVKRLSQESNFRIINITTRFLPMNFAKIPVLGEFLTWHVEFLLKKK